MQGSVAAPEQGFATIQSGAPSAGAHTEQQRTGDEWAAGWTTTGETASTSGSAGTGSPRIIVESADGHSIEITYEDLVLGLLLVTLAMQVAGWFR